MYNIIICLSITAHTIFFTYRDASSESLSKITHKWQSNCHLFLGPMNRLGAAKMYFPPGSPPSYLKLGWVCTLSWYQCLYSKGPFTFLSPLPGHQTFSSLSQASCQSPAELLFSIQGRFWTNHPGPSFSPIWRTVDAAQPPLRAQGPHSGFSSPPSSSSSCFLSISP